MLKKIFFVLSFLIVLMKSSFASGTIVEEYDIRPEAYEQTFNEPELNRDFIHIKKYSPENTTIKKSTSILFLHGGPGLQDEGQFAMFISSFAEKGYTVYVPEIIGSSFYNTDGMDANEYEKPYQKDIQHVINHIQEITPGKLFAISHSLGCHQLFNFLLLNTHSFDAVSAIAGAWDAGANRYSAMKKINQTPEGLWNVINSRRSFLGEYAIKKEDQKNITETYNPIVSEDLNQLFSVFYHSDNIPFDLPIQFIHAKDDSAVAFSLSVDMFEALRSQDKPVSAYFISSGGHGFIKNPIATDTTQQDLYPKQRLEIASRILTFFDNSKKETGEIYFDGMPETIENLKANDYKDVRIDHALFLATQKSAK